MSQKEKHEEDFEPWPEFKKPSVKRWDQPRILLLTPESNLIKMYATTQERMADAMEEVYLDNPFVNRNNIWPVSIVHMALFRKSSQDSLPEPVWSEDFVAKIPGQKNPEKVKMAEKDARDQR